MLSESIRRMSNYCSALGGVVVELQRELEEAKQSWPDHQVVVGAEWHDRSETPPAGYVWASNGTRVWLIHSDGTPIGKYATAVLYWTTAFIPAPPDFVKPENKEYQDEYNQ